MLDTKIKYRHIRKKSAKHLSLLLFQQLEAEDAVKTARIAELEVRTDKN